MQQTFKIYTSRNSDTELFVHDGKVEKNTFVFTGFSNKEHPYYLKQMNWATTMLKSAGIILNISRVRTVHEIGDPDKGEFEVSDIKIPDNLQKSSDGNTYYLVQDEEMGRGWAVLIKISGDDSKIIHQDHRDIIRDKILSEEFIKGFGIDYERVHVEDVEEEYKKIKATTNN